MHDTSTRSSPSDRRRLRYGYCTRGLGRSSRMLSAGLQFFCLRPALVAQAMGHFSGQCAPRYTDGITTMTIDIRSLQRYGNRVMIRVVVLTKVLTH